MSGSLEAGHVPLQGLASGILGPAVLVALVFAETGLHVGRGLVDGGHDRAGEWLRDLPGVHRPGGEALSVVLRKNARHRCLGREGGLKINPAGREVTVLGWAGPGTTAGGGDS